MDRHLTRNSCLICSRIREKSCCCFGVLLTIEDIENLKRIGYSDEHILGLICYSKEEAEQEERWFFENLVEFEGNFYRVGIRRKDDGSCAFLEPGKGCLLNENRPIICRLYPYWMEEDKIVRQSDDFCYILYKSDSVNKGIKINDENEENIKYLFNKIKEDSIKNKDLIISMTKNMLENSSRKSKRDFFNSNRVKAIIYS